MHRWNGLHVTTIEPWRPAKRTVTANRQAIAPQRQPRCVREEAGPFPGQHAWPRRGWVYGRVTNADPIPGRFVHGVRLARETASDHDPFGGMAARTLLDQSCAPPNLFHDWPRDLMAQIVQHMMELSTG